MMEMTSFDEKIMNFEDLWKKICGFGMGFLNYISTMWITFMTQSIFRNTRF
jgi:hypothetical protein